MASHVTHYAFRNTPDVRYANVWEDADVLCEALAPRARGGRLLSVASAGDNALALLTLDPAEVVVVDRSPAQLACFWLRVAAFRHLEARLLPAFLGVEWQRTGRGPSSVRPAARAWRTEIYRRLRAELPSDARAFWDSRSRAVAGGVSHAGKLERYLRHFRRLLLPLVHSRSRIEQLSKARSPDERAWFYDRVWDTPGWRRLFRLYFSRPVMARLGRDPECFAHVAGGVADPILARTRHALVTLPPRENPFLAYVLTGGFPPEARPRYLRPDQIPLIRDRLDRLRPAGGDGRGDLFQITDGTFDGFNLSDVWETATLEEQERGYAALLTRARPGARLVYWNLVVPRGRPASLAGRVRPLPEVSAALHAQDRAWFYGALHVDEVGDGRGGRCAG
jgi:S-adenosylmethionine-diacylglycerol 3-amino-3-carboxypropyl transferase